MSLRRLLRSAPSPSAGSDPPPDCWNETRASAPARAHTRFQRSDKEQSRGRQWEPWHYESVNVDVVVSERDTAQAMSRENVEIVRRLYRAMNAWDTKVVADLAHPEVEWVPDQRVGEGPVRGLENVMRFFGERAEVLDGLRTDVEQLWETGDQILAFVRVVGLGTGSGAGFDIRIAHLWTLSDGVVIRGEGYGDRAEALQAVGLKE